MACRDGAATVPFSPAQPCGASYRQTVSPRPCSRAADRPPRRGPRGGLAGLGRRPRPAAREVAAQRRHRRAARRGARLCAARSCSAAYYVALLRSMGCTGNSHETAVLFGGDDRAFLGLVQELAGGDGAGVGCAARRRFVATSAPELAARAHAGVVPHDGQDRRPQRRALGVRGLDGARAPARPARRGPGGARPGLRALGRARARRRSAARRCACPRASRTSSTSSRSPYRAGGVRGGARAHPQAHRRPLRPRDRRRASIAAPRSCSPSLRRRRHARRPRWTPSRRRSRAARASELEGLARAIADFADLKSPWTLGHSPAVAELAAAAAPRRGSRDAACSPASCTTSAASPCPTASGTSPSRSSPRSGSGCACTRTTRSASSRGRRSSRGSRRSRAHITSASTARAITAASARTR